jgi:hypothetical protein
VVIVGFGCRRPTAEQMERAVAATEEKAAKRKPAMA